MSKSVVVILVSILCLSAFLRFYRLASLPPSLEWDEVATGYDAYSILKTGKDQFGNFFPLTFRSIDDYKPPLYTYLVTVSIAIFGWNDFAVRFPAAFMGVLAVLTTYAMTYELFRRRKLALLSSLLLAISPWHVNFSRLALETNSTIFFTTAGIWAFFIGLKNGKFLILASVFFGLNLYLYHNARVFTPLIGIVLLFFYAKEIWKHQKYMIVSAVIVAIFVIRLIPIMFSIEGQMRFIGTSIFTPDIPLETYKEKQQYISWKKDDNNNGEELLGKVFHSEKVFFALKILKNYISHYNPSFWLFTDDYKRHHVSGMGLLYFPDMPFIYIGLFFLFKQNHRRSVFLLLLWFLFAPISAAVTRDVPHALRSVIFLPTFQIFISIALIGLFDRLKQKKYTKIFSFTFIIFLYVLNNAFFLHQYFVHFAKDTSQEWQYGRREAALFADTVKDKFDQIIVSTKLEHSNLFFLYYLKYDPIKYLQEGGTNSGGWAEQRNKFDKYLFKQFSYEEMKDGKTLFIGEPNEFTTGVVPLKKIYYLDGKEAIWIVEG